MFKKENQVHSCTVSPLDNHFKGKEDVARPLFKKLKERVEKNIGAFRVESLPCCIHLVGTHTFAAVYALKKKFEYTLRWTVS